jgi:hypothetical protein
MAGTAGDDPTGRQVFRSRAVSVAGIVDVVAGGCVLIVGLVVVIGRANRDALPLGVAISVVGLILALTGLGRMAARLEVTATTVVWTWAFSRHELPLSELEDAALVEKGSPASGASWAGFLGGGFLGVLAWWLVELVAAFVSSEPSIGAYDLVVYKHHGAPVEMKPISSWSTRSSHSQADQALQAVRAAITASARLTTQPQHLRILQHDA